MLLLETLKSKYGGDPDKHCKERWLPHLTHIVGVLLASLHQAATWRGWSTAGGRGGNRLTWDTNLRLSGISGSTGGIVVGKPSNPLASDTLANRMHEWFWPGAHFWSCFWKRRREGVNSGQPAKREGNVTITITITITWAGGGWEAEERRPDAKSLGSLDRES